MFFVFMMSLLMFGFAIVLALQNSTMVVVRFLMWQFNLQIALLVLVAFFLGFLTNLFISFPHRLKKNKFISESNKKMKKMEEDLAKYRNMLLGSHKV